MFTVIRYTDQPEIRLCQVRNPRRFFGRMYNLTDASLARIERISCLKATTRKLHETRRGDTLTVGQEINTRYG